MPKLLQLNCTANWGSTGKIAEGIGQAAMARGWESTIAYGREMNPSQSRLVKVGNQFDVYAHYAQHRLFDREGLGSRRPTRRLIKWIDSYRPDIIHLHNIHDHWLNYPFLFQYLATIDTPIVWTFHDCWAFTGGCAHFVETGCNQWQTSCKRCPVKRCTFFRNEASNHRMHIEYFGLLGSRLHIVSVSSWLDGLVGKSALRHIPHTYIYNGIDCNMFRPCDNSHILSQSRIQDKKILLGVSNVWSKSKGIDNFIKLSKLLDDSYRIVLIGLQKGTIKNLPYNIIPVSRTHSQDTLAKWYSVAMAVISLSKAETFGLTLAEGLACGTPAIAYDVTALPEVISTDTGIVVPKGNIKAVVEAIKTISSSDSYSKEICRARAETNFNKDIQFGKYVDLYESLL